MAEKNGHLIFSIIIVVLGGASLLLRPSLKYLLVLIAFIVLEIVSWLISKRKPNAIVNLVIILLCSLFVLFVITDMLHLNLKIALLCWVSAIALLIVLFVLWVAFEVIKTHKIGDSLLAECDPEKYIAQKEKENAKTPKNNFHKLCIAEGHIYLGQYNEAMDVFNSMDLPAFISGMALRQKKLEAIVYLLLTECYLDLDDLENADLTIEKVKKLFKEDEAKLLCDCHHLAFEYLLQNNDQPLQYFYDRLLADDKNVKKHTNFVRTMFSYKKGILELKMGMTEEARESFNEVVRLGNKLYIKQLALEKLKELP